MHYEAHFSDLYAAVDGLHARFRQQAARNSEEEALGRLWLAVHEWMANLARHARFGERAPEVHVRIWRQNTGLRCTIKDNSDGFDLEAELERKQAVTSLARALPEGGMGLLLMEAGTEHLEYGAPDGRLNRLHLSVRTDAATADAGGAP